MNEPDDIIGLCAKHEAERQMFGHELYEIQGRLPQLVLFTESGNHNVEEIIESTKLFIKVANEFGEYLTHVYADLCLMYNINDLDDTEDVEKHNIRITYIVVRGILAHSLLQAELLEKLLAEDNTAYGFLDIMGPQYYMIAVALQNLPYGFHSLINMVHARRYYDEGYCVSIRERLNFLVSPEYEHLRKTFRSVECYELRRELPSLSTTLH